MKEVSTEDFTVNFDNITLKCSSWKYILLSSDKLKPFFATISRTWLFTFGVSQFGTVMIKECHDNVVKKSLS